MWFLRDDILTYCYMKIILINSSFGAAYKFIFYLLKLQRWDGTGYDLIGLFFYCNHSWNKIFNPNMEIASETVWNIRNLFGFLKIILQEFFRSINVKIKFDVESIKIFVYKPYASRYIGNKLIFDVRK